MLPIARQIEIAGAKTYRAIGGIRTAPRRGWHDSKGRNLLGRESALAIVRPGTEGKMKPWADTIRYDTVAG